MSNYILKEKETAITEYFNAQKENIEKGIFSIKTIKNELRNIMGEEIDLDIKWRVDTLITEKNRQKVKEDVDKVNSITIAFSDGSYKNTDIPAVHKLMFYFK